LSSLIADGDLLFMGLKREWLKKVPATDECVAIIFLAREPLLLTVAVIGSFALLQQRVG